MAQEHYCHFSGLIFKISLLFYRILAYECSCLKKKKKHEFEILLYAFTLFLIFSLEYYLGNLALGNVLAR